MPNFEPGGFWIRAGARAIDWLVQMIVGGVVGVVLGIIAAIIEGVGGGSTSRFLESFDDNNWVSWVGSALAALSYHSIFEGLAGTTAGKRALGLQVIGEPAVPIRFIQAVKRSVAIVVDALFFGAIGWMSMSETPERRRIGDNWADTRVVFRRSLPPELLPSTLRVFGAMVAAVAVCGTIDLATYVFSYLWFIRG